MLENLKNPCEEATEFIGNGRWKNCSTCKYINWITVDYICIKEKEYQAQCSILRDVVEWLGSKEIAMKYCGDVQDARRELEQLLKESKHESIS